MQKDASKQLPHRGRPQMQGAGRGCVPPGGGSFAYGSSPLTRVPPACCKTKPLLWAHRWHAQLFPMLQGVWSRGKAAAPPRTAAGTRFLAEVLLHQPTALTASTLGAKDAPCTSDRGKGPSGLPFPVTFRKGLTRVSEHPPGAPRSAFRCRAAPEGVRPTPPAVATVQFTFNVS